MRYELDDPILTAYALGELEGEQKSAVEAQVADCDETRRAIDEIRAAAFVLSDDLRKEANTWSLQELWRAVLTLREKASNMVRPAAASPRWVVGGLAAAAGLVIAFSLAAVLWPKLRNNPNIVQQPATQPGFTIIMAGTMDGSSGLGGAAGGATFDAKGLMHRSFVSVAQSPTSSFALAAHGQSYEDVRSSIELGRLPLAGMVRIEEMINAFSYRYPQPQGDAVLAAAGEVGPCPWNSSHQIVRIGIRAKDWTGPTTAPAAIATSVRAQVEFNPLRVASFRMIGYETPAQDGAVLEAGESLRPGEAVTALYEVVPARAGAATAFDGLKYQHPPQPTAAARSSEVLTVKLTFTPAGSDAARSVEVAVADPGEGATPSDDLRFAGAVASFGMLLRDSPHKGQATFAGTAELAAGALGSDPRRAEFLAIVRKAAGLARG